MPINTELRANRFLDQVNTHLEGGDRVTVPEGVDPETVAIAIVSLVAAVNWGQQPEAPSVGQAFEVVAHIEGISVPQIPEVVGTRECPLRPYGRKIFDESVADVALAAADILFREGSQPNEGGPSSVRQTPEDDVSFDNLRATLVSLVQQLKIDKNYATVLAILFRLESVNKEKAREVGLARMLQQAEARLRDETSRSLSPRGAFITINAVVGGDRDGRRPVGMDGLIRAEAAKQTIDDPAAASQHALEVVQSRLASELALLYGA